MSLTDQERWPQSDEWLTYLLGIVNGGSVLAGE